jgi:hypothetical protein
MILRKYQEKDKLSVNLYRSGGIMKYGAGDVMDPPTKTPTKNPVVTPTTSDPTLEDYLKVYNSALDLDANVKKLPNYTLKEELKLEKDDWATRLAQAKNDYETWQNPNSETLKNYAKKTFPTQAERRAFLANHKNYDPASYYKQESPNTFYQRELSYGYLNKNLPMAYYDSRIKPTLERRYLGVMGGDEMDDAVELVTYDPKVVKEEALKKFPGSEKEFEKIDKVYTPPQPKLTGPPAGWQPFTIYGRPLDPEIYGYGESVKGTPIELPQFADSYEYKIKMREYKKTGKYPWAKN